MIEAMISMSEISATRRIRAGALPLASLLLGLIGGCRVR